MHYFDTCVLVALYLPEPMNAKVQRLYAESKTVAISGLSEVEFHSAIARRVRMKELSKDDARKVLAQFRAHADGSLYRMIAVEQSDYVVARDWIAQMVTPLRVLDAIHLAVASSNSLTLVTADEVLATSAKHFGVKHKLIR